jgi:PilZ domain
MIEDLDNPLLGFLGSKPRAVGDAFRTNPRRGARRRARLSWGEGVLSRAVPARLINISRMGAALTTAESPPHSGLVRLRLAGDTPTPWLEADVLGIDRDERRKFRVRLKFREPCPTIFLKTAVLGVIAPAADDTVAAIDPEEC